MALGVAREQDVAQRVHPARLLLERVVGGEDVAHRRDDRRRRRRNEQGRDRAVIETKSSGEGERPPVLRPLRSGKQDLLLDGNVPEKAAAELRVRSRVDRIGGGRLRKEPVQAGMVCRKPARDRACRMRGHGAPSATATSIFASVTHRSTHS